MVNQFILKIHDMLSSKTTGAGQGGRSRNSTDNRRQAAVGAASWIFGSRILDIETFGEQGTDGAGIMYTCVSNMF